MTSIPIVYNAAKLELEEILDAGARSLRPAGLELLPIKRNMLRMDDAHAFLVLDACNLLFAAVLAYEQAQWDINRAGDPIELVRARLEAGRAEGVVCALFHGTTAPLLLAALDHAPIAFYALAQASPQLKIIDRANASGR